MKSPRKEPTVRVRPKPTPLPAPPPPPPIPPSEPEPVIIKPPSETTAPPVTPELSPNEPVIKPSPQPWEAEPTRAANSWGLGLIILFILASAAFAVILGKNVNEYINEYMDWREKLRNRLPKLPKQKSKDILIAQYNGRTHHLGALARLRTVHVGSESNNTLRIQDDAIAARHLCIYLKRGRLMLRNLARSIVWVNQKPVKPRRKHALVLPATVRLSDTVTLQFTATHPSAASVKMDEEV